MSNRFSRRALETTQKLLRLIAAASLSLLYALAMAVDASAALFFGWLLGALYDFNPVYLVMVSVAAQACSILFYVLCIKVRKA